MCDVCEYADVHGWWGADLARSHATHCRSCHQTWRGTQLMHCVSCCQNFSSPSVCDLHKNGTRCLDPALVRDDETGVLLLELQDLGFNGMVWTRQGALIGGLPPRQIASGVLVA